jgi:hypothetical protein
VTRDQDSHMREINLTVKQIKTLKERHKVCRELKECDRIKAILLQNKDRSLARIAEALLIHVKVSNAILMTSWIKTNLNL